MRPHKLRVLFFLFLFHVSYHSLFAKMPEAERQKLQNQAIALYYDKNYYEALKIFQKILKEYPYDLVSRQYFEEAYTKHTAATVIIKDALKWLEQGNLKKAYE
ncbi:MAG: hypothetical protein D6767_03975, partial [Candidatus Hydrogenedentota bacterium]